MKFLLPLLRALLILGWIVCCLTTPGQDAEPNNNVWPRFRGPDGLGLNPGSSCPIPRSESDIAWKIELPGKGHSSPVVWKDKVFVTAGNPASAQRFLLCLRSADGHVTWTREYPSQTHRLNRDNSYATSTPAVDEARVYFYWTTPEAANIAAVQHDGTEVWRRNLGSFASQHGGGTSPICFEDKVIINNDQDGQSFLIALEARTGEPCWKIPRRTDRTAYATPCVYRPVGKAPELIFTSSSHGVTSVNPKTGQVNWELTNAFPWRVVGSPTVADGLIVASCGEGGIGRRLVTVNPGAQDHSPTLAYEMKTKIPYVPTPIAIGKHLFLWGDNGLIVCLLAKTGQRIWEEKIPATFYGSPIWADGRLYCLSKEGVLYVIAADAHYSLVASMPLGEPSFATPAVANHTLYLRTETHLMAIKTSASNSKPQ
jgi:outer membrane protein assembly factor BamB